MDTWSLILVMSALAGGRVQPLGTITMQNKEACLAALETINRESRAAIGGFCVDQKTGAVDALPATPSARLSRRRR
jgi:hypothetical protein